MHTALAIYSARRIRANAVIDLLTDVMVERGVPAYMRRDNRPERIAKALRNWSTRVGTKTAYILRGRPWENGYCESFNGTLRNA
jgi:transposase InsO family protein